jgi:hypothetical protein
MNIRSVPRAMSLGAATGILLLCVGLAVGGCDQQSTVAGEVLSADDRVLAHKFRSISGGELFVDSISEMHGVNIFNERGEYIYGRGTLNPKNNSRHAYNSEFGVPKFIRVVWRDGYETRDGGSTLNAGIYTGGNILGDYTVPVAARYPDELLDAVRAGKGELRLKIRIHEAGPLIGWDMQTPTSTELAGGDFREAEIVGGKVMRKGWYVHPKTRERIETDF